MNFARIREVSFVLLAMAMSAFSVNDLLAKEPAAGKLTPNAKEGSGKKGVQCCGLLLRTDFGHPDRLAELSIQPDTVMTNCIDSGKSKGLVEAFDVYFQDIDKEFGDAAKRDIVRLRLNQVFKTVVNDATRSSQLFEGFRKFAFASVLASKGLSARAIDEVRQARVAFLRAVPADSFCLMPVELYLATALADTGESEEAVAIAQGVVNRSRKAYGERDEFVGLALVGLAKAQMAATKPDLAEASLRESMRILADVPEIQPNAYLLNCNVFAEALLAQSKNAEAAELMAYLDPQMRTLFHDQLVPPVFTSVMMRAKALVALERYEEAEKVLGRFPELMLSIREPGVAGRDLLHVYVSLLEKTDRAAQAGPSRKCIAKIDARIASASRR